MEDVVDHKPASFMTKLRTTVTADGKRSSAATFLAEKDIESKSNLKICLGAVAQRLEIDEENRVQGVYVETEHSSVKTFYVKGKEIILCGGAVASPQLLLLRYFDSKSSNISGIGPKEQLDVHNIPCKVDLPGVGTQLVFPLSIV